MRNVREDVTDDEIVSALQTACAWDFVSQLPNGIYSALGERGRGISEGQAQRLSIARALLRGAPILLLDEATSALDVETEETVLRNIISRHPNKAIIISTHRPGALKLCQKIYRIRDGCIKEASPAEIEPLLSRSSDKTAEDQNIKNSEQETFLREQAAHAVPAPPELLRSEDESGWWMP